jgi:hypothetical protein
MRSIELNAGETARLSKMISVAQQTTRRHFPGEHHLELIVNGPVSPAGSFWLTA